MLTPVQRRDEGRRVSLEPERVRKVGISLACELLAEIIPLGLWWLCAIVHNSPNVLEHIVSSAVILVLAFGILMLTFAEFWIVGRKFDLMTLTGVLVALMTVGMAGLTFDLVYGSSDNLAVQMLLMFQVLSAVFALAYSAIAR